MLIFPKSLVDNFRHNNKGKRYGQAFYDFAKLHRVKGEDRYFCNKLYNEENEQKVKNMINSRTDFNN